jgi:hypothetical protein
MPQKPVLSKAEEGTKATALLMIEKWIVVNEWFYCALRRKSSPRPRRPVRIEHTVTLLTIICNYNLCLRNCKHFPLRIIISYSKYSPAFRSEAEIPACLWRGPTFGGFTRLWRGVVYFDIGHWIFDIGHSIPSPLNHFGNV